MNGKCVLGLVLMPVLVLCACSAQNSLAQRLAGADRVIVTNVSDGLSITATGEEVKKIVHAIAAGKKESPFITASPYLQFQFFKGAEHLGTITTAVQVFWIGDKPYSDPTGTLEALTQRYREEHPPTLRP